jgi:hypothetical protein
MSKSSFKPGKVERFYWLMGYVFAMAFGFTTVSTWIGETFVEGYTRLFVTPGAVTFLLIFGWVVMVILEVAEKSHRKSVKFYLHGGKSILVK